MRKSIFLLSTDDAFICVLSVAFVKAATGGNLEFTAASHRVFVASPHGQGYAPDMCSLRTIFGWTAAVVAIATASHGTAQQVAVRTNATSAAGVVSQSDLVIGDLDERAFSAPLFQLAEHGDPAVPSLFTDAACIWALNPREPARYRIFELPLVQTERRDIHEFDAQRPIGALAVSPTTASNRHLAVSTGAGDDSVLLVFDRDAEGLYLTDDPAEIRLPGRLIDLTWLPEPGRWAALCESSGGPVVELIGDTERSQFPVTVGYSLHAQRIAGVGETLLVLASGYDVQRADGAPVTSLQAVYPEERRTTEPLALPGAPVASVDALFVVDSRSVWVSTETRGTSIVTASLVDCEGAITIQTVLSLPTAKASFHVAGDSGGESFLFACGRNVKRYGPDGERLGAHQFDAPVHALTWGDDVLVVGEGNRVHRLHGKSLVPERTIQLYSGRVADLSVQTAALAALGDSDGDGVLDTVDHHPGERVPGLVVPRTVRLRRSAPGIESRAIPLDMSVSLRGYRYRLNEPQSQGLVAEPRAGALPGVLTIGLDPAYWLEADARASSIPLTLTMHEDGETEPLSTATIDVIVEAAPPVDVRVLVIPNRLDDETSGIDKLLREPPQDYSVTIEQSPLADSLADYQIVVVSLEAVLAGRVPRVALEHYVANGGGLLIAGSSTVVPRLDQAREWLAPFRIDVRSASGTLRAVREDCDWCEVWSSAGLREGLLATVEPPGRVMFMPGRAAREGPMTRTPLGLGRIVFVGSESLLTAASTSPPIQEALMDAVRWLARTRTEVLDTDGDGLADDVEDVNRNGVVDMGETDPHRADTDGDLVVDGLEDANGNGRLDEGETDPRNPDTDGDRIPDGADSEPLPATGAKLVRGDPGFR